MIFCCLFKLNDLLLFMDLKVYKIYAFTDLHVASGDRGVSALCLCLWAQQRRKERFSPIFSLNFLSRHIHWSLASN